MMPRLGFSSRRDARLVRMVMRASCVDISSPGCLTTFCKQYFVWRVFILSSLYVVAGSFFWGRDKILRYSDMSLMIFVGFGGGESHIVWLYEWNGGFSISLNPKSSL